MSGPAQLGNAILDALNPKSGALGAGPGGGLGWIPGSQELEAVESGILLGAGVLGSAYGRVAGALSGATKIVDVPASSMAQGARLAEHLRQWEKYGSQGFKELENGRSRYYGDLDLARTPGTMIGRRVVREWDPATGATRTWHETLDAAGNVRQVRPQTGDAKIHYGFDADGNFIGTR
jgi:hypothetical protein